MMPRWGQPRAKAPPVNMGPPPRDPAAQVGTPCEGDAAARGSATPRPVDPERQTGGERLPDEWIEPDSRQPPWERMAFSVDRQRWERLPDGLVWETAPNEGPPAWATRPRKTSATNKMNDMEDAATPRVGTGMPCQGTPSMPSTELDPSPSHAYTVIKERQKRKEKAEREAWEKDLAHMMAD